MRLRPSARLISSVGALTLAATLTSCGFDYATDRVYTPTAGVNDRDADLDVLNAVIVAEHDGEGAFVASLANNLTDESVTLDSIAGADDSTLSADDLSPVEVPAGQLVNLADEDPIVVTGDFSPGDVVSVTIGLGDGESIDMAVPVVPPCNEFEGLAPSTSSTGSSSDSYECDVEAPATEEH